MAESPLTAFEKLIQSRNAEISSAVVTGTNGDTLLVYSASRINDQLMLADGRFLAQPLLFDLNYQTECPDGDCEITVKFDHAEVNYYSSLNTIDLPPVLCEYNQTSSYDFACGNGYNVTVECDGQFYGTIYASCPYSKEVPKCLELYSNEVIDEDSCIVTSSTATSTTCMCHVYVANDSGDWTLQQRRRLLDMVDVNDLPRRRTNSSVEIVPTKINQYVPAQFNYTHDPTSMPSSAPSSIPTLVPTSAPSTDRAYPIYSFGIRSAIDFNVNSVSPIELTAEDNETIANATMSVLFQALDVHTWVTNISVVPSDDGLSQVLTVTVDSLLRQDSFCTYEEAYDGFADQLRWAIEDTSVFMQHFQKAKQGSSSALALVTAVTVRSTPFGDIGFVKTSASACTHQPTSQPTSVSGTNGGSTNSGGGSSGAESTTANAAADYGALYVAGLAAFALMSVVYVFYSNRNKAILRMNAEEQEEQSGSSGESGGADLGSSQHSGIPTSAVAVSSDPVGGEFLTEEYFDYSFGSDAVGTQDDPNAPTAAFEWTGLDTSTTASSDFFTRPAAMQSQQQHQPSSVHSETDSRSGSGMGFKYGNPLKAALKSKSKAKNSTGGKALKLGELRTAAAAGRMPPRDVVTEANRSWSEAYNDGMWPSEQS